MWPRVGGRKHQVEILLPVVDLVVSEENFREAGTVRLGFRAAAVAVDRGRTADDERAQDNGCAATRSYTVTFAKGELPPGRGFWSLTGVHEHPIQVLPAVALVTGPRYLLNQSSTSWMASCCRAGM
jgi:hypothetical protein